MQKALSLRPALAGVTSGGCFAGNVKHHPIRKMKKEQTKKVVRKEFEIKPLSDDFVMPVKAKRGSIGYDLTVPHDILILAHSRVKIPLDFAINLPNGIEAKIEPRSGCSLHGMVGVGAKKRKLKLFGFIPVRKKFYGRQTFDADVLPGKIDPNYTDNVHVLLKNNDVEFTIKAGTRIAQMTFYSTVAPFFRIVDQLSCKSRGGGFCSSGLYKIDPARKRYLPVTEKDEAVVAEADITSPEPEAAPSVSNE